MIYKLLIHNNFINSVRVENPVTVSRILGERAGRASHATAGDQCLCGDMQRPAGHAVSAHANRKRHGGVIGLRWTTPRCRPRL